MVKNYILDTNVLIHDPDALYSFEDNNVLIPLPVLEELDKLKKETGRLGHKARETIRKLEELREIGDLQQGVQLPNGGTLRVIALNEDVIDKNRTKFLFEKYVDNWILTYAVVVKNNESNNKFVHRIVGPKCAIENS